MSGRMFRMFVRPLVRQTNTVRIEIDVPEFKPARAYPAWIVKSATINHPVALETLKCEPDICTTPWAEFQLQPTT